MVQSVLIFSIRDVRAALQSTALHIYFLGHCTIYIYHHQQLYQKLAVRIQYSTIAMW